MTTGRIGKGQSSLEGMKGSFMNDEQRNEFQNHIQTAGMHDVLNNKEHELLSEEEVLGEGEVLDKEEANDTTDSSEKQGKKTSSSKLADNDICPECGKILVPEIKFSDEELMNYLLGARIERTFNIGPISYKIQSITQREVDDANYRTGRDVDSGNAILEVDVQNRLSMYFLVYQLTEINGSRIGKEVPQNPSVEEYEEWHNMIVTKVKSYGHILMTNISQRCGQLEAAIKDTLENETRLKK